MNEKQTYYGILGVGEQATASDIKKAFNQLALTLHPDKVGADYKPEKWLPVLGAYDILSDPDKKALYDQQLRLNINIDIDMVGLTQS